MNRRPLIIFLTLVSFTFASLVGCKPKEVTLNGQVFIVTKSAGNIKLGDVDVFLVEKANVLEFLHQKQESAKKDYANIRQELASANRELEEARARYNAFIEKRLFTTNADYIQAAKNRDQEQQTLLALKSRHESIQLQNSQLRKAARATLDKRTPEYVHLDFMANSIVELEWRGIRIPDVQPPSYEPPELQAWRDFLKSIRPEMAALVEKINDAEQRKDAFNAQLLQIQRRAENSEKGRVSHAESRQSLAKQEMVAFSTAFEKRFFDNFPTKFVKEEHTDADGKFSFTYPVKNDLVVFAKAQRLVIEETETYFWLVNVPTDLKPAFILSNSKLTDVDPDGYIKSVKYE